MTELRAGRSIRGSRDTYLVERAAGAGSCGQTYLAKGESGRRFVLEEVALGKVDEWATVDDCIRTMGRLRRLRHPAVVPVIETFVFDTNAAPLSVVVVHGNPGGETLGAAIADGHSFEAIELTEMFRSLLEALRYVHALSPPLVHRNLAPESVILADDRAKLSGLGLVAGGASDPRDDLFQLASVILFAATHRRVEELATRRGAVDLGKLAPNLEPQLRRALAAALDPVRARRPASAAALLAMLDEWRFSPRAVVRAVRGRRPGRRAALGAAALVLLGVGARAALSRADLAEEPEAEVPAIASDRDSGLDITQCPGKPGCPELPAAESDATTDTPLPLLVWRATLLEARGIAIDGECMLELRGNELYGDAADCEVKLRCGSRSLSHHVGARVCQLRQTKLAGERSVYELWFAASSEPIALGDDLVIDSGRKRLSWKGYDSRGTANASVTMKIGASESAAPSAISPHHFPSPVVRTGVITDARGNTTMRNGQKCSLTLSSLPPGEENCSAQIRCGAQTLYEQAGRCIVLDDGATFFEDGASSLIDGSPAVDVTSNSVVLDDISVEGKSTVEITLFNRASE